MGGCAEYARVHLDSAVKIEKGRFAGAEEDTAVFALDASRVHGAFRFPSFRPFLLCLCLLRLPSSLFSSFASPSLFFLSLVFFASRPLTSSSSSPPLLSTSSTGAYERSARQWEAYTQHERSMLRDINERIRFKDKGVFVVYGQGCAFLSSSLPTLSS
jgi:hypothetical protein